MNIREIVSLRKRKCGKLSIEFDTCIVSTKELDDVLNELEEKQDEINVLTAQRDSIENQFNQAKKVVEKKDKIISDSIVEIENLRQYFSEDLQPDFIRILEMLKDKKVIDW